MQFQSKYNGLVSAAALASNEQKYILNDHGRQPTTYVRELGRSAFMTPLDLVSSVNDRNAERRAATFLNNKVKSGELTKVDFGSFAGSGFGQGQRLSGKYYVPSQLIQSSDNKVIMQGEFGSGEIERNA